MERIAQFEIVSEKQFLLDGTKEQYDQIKLPRRATEHSAGYDFFLNENLTLAPNKTAKIPTGIRAKINEGWVLKIYPRSSLGFKYRLTLNNTVGIIDGDYYFADNEGHIFIKITNCGDKEMVLEKGQAFAQGIFIQYGITFDDDCTTKRHGGLGSTDKK